MNMAGVRASVDFYKNFITNAENRPSVAEMDIEESERRIKSWEVLLESRNKVLKQRERV